MTKAVAAGSDHRPTALWRPQQLHFDGDAPWPVLYKQYAFVYCMRILWLIHHFSPRGHQTATAIYRPSLTGWGHRQWVVEPSLPASHAQDASEMGSAMETASYIYNFVVNFSALYATGTEVLGGHDLEQMKCQDELIDGERAGPESHVLQRADASKNGNLPAIVCPIPVYWPRILYNASTKTTQSSYTVFPTLGASR